MQFIVAVDGSEQGERALGHAIDLAGAAGAGVTVVHAVDPSVYSEGGGEPAGALADEEGRLVIEDVEDAEGRGSEVLEEAREFAADRGFDVETELLYGDPPEAIGEYAESIEADGIFVGHRGLTGRAEQLLGSVAKDLLEVATMPVTVVR